MLSWTARTVSIPEISFFFYKGAAHFAVLHNPGSGSVQILLYSSSIPCGVSWKFLTEAREKGSYLKIFSHMWLDFSVLLRNNHRHFQIASLTHRKHQQS